jgi:hypothetical protein
MAAVFNPRLTINLIASTSDTDVIGTVDVSFTPFETFLINGAGLRYLLKCKLIGEDSGFNGSNDDLFIFQAQTITAPGTFTFRSNVNRSTLDEDSVGNDEIFAEFTLQSAEPSFPFAQSTNSPVISGDF